MFNTIFPCCSKSDNYRPQRVKSYGPFGSGYVRVTHEPNKTGSNAAKLIGVVLATMILIAGITALVLHATLGLPQTFQLIAQLDPGALTGAIVVPLIMTGLTSFALIKWGSRLCKTTETQKDNVEIALTRRDSIYINRNDLNTQAMLEGEPPNIS